MGTNTDTKLIEISPYMHQIGHLLNSREITRNVQEGRDAAKVREDLRKRVILQSCTKAAKPATATMGACRA